MNDIALVFHDKTYARRNEETFYLRKIEKAHKGIAEKREGPSEANFYQRSLRGENRTGCRKACGCRKNLCLCLVEQVERIGGHPFPFARGDLIAVRNRKIM